MNKGNDRVGGIYIFISNDLIWVLGEEGLIEKDFFILRWEYVDRYGYMDVIIMDRED